MSNSDVVHFTCFVCGREYPKPMYKSAYDTLFAGKKRRCCSYTCSTILHDKKEFARLNKIKEADLL